MTTGQTCRLCCKEKELRESHIIPKFVLDWQKASSGTGFMRSAEMPNKRAQDGEKEHLLCDECEALFNQWETLFANKLFQPLNRQEAMRFEYDAWLLKFAISVSWRSLTWYKSNDLPELSESARDLIDNALQTWKEFLLDQRQDPGLFEQHMIVFGPPKSVQNIRDLPSNFNRFLLRGCHIHLADENGRPLYIYTKMGRVTLLGFIGVKHPRQWAGTKIHVKRGVIGGNVLLPLQFLNYMKERATVELRLNETISIKQQDLIERSYVKKRDRAVMSDTLQSLSLDVRMFGKNAVFDDKDLTDET